MIPDDPSAWLPGVPLDFDTILSGDGPMPARGSLVSAWRRSDVADGQLGRSLRNDAGVMICPLGLGWLLLDDEGEVSSSDLAVLLAVRGLPAIDADALAWVRGRS